MTLPTHITPAQLADIDKNGCRVTLAGEDGKLIEGAPVLSVGGDDVATSAKMAVVTVLLQFAAPDLSPVLAMRAAILSSKGKPLAQCGHFGVMIGGGNFFDVPAASIMIPVG